MINQIRVEMYKLVRSVFFWLAIVFMVCISIYSGIKWDVQAHQTDLMVSFAYTLPDLSFVFLPGLFTSWFIGSNFGNRTIHHEITSGSSRLSVILSRMLPAVVSGFFIHCTFIAVTVLVHGMRVGFGSFVLTADYWKWMGVVLLQLIAIECFFTFVSFLCCNLYTGLIATTISVFTLVNVFRNIFADSQWYKVSFLHFAESSASSELVPCAIAAVVSIVVLTGLSYLVFRKREI